MQTFENKPENSYILGPVYYCVLFSNFSVNTIAHIRPDEGKINTVDLGKSHLIAYLWPLLFNWNIHNLIVLLLNMIPKWLYFRRGEANCRDMGSMGADL